MVNEQQVEDQKVIVLRAPLAGHYANPDRYLGS
jgi:hypothetical protein